MTLEQILGSAIVVAAYGALWYLVIYSRKIVEKIDSNELKRLREIKQELGMTKEKNG